MSAVTGGERILVSGSPQNTKAVIHADAPRDPIVAVRVDIADEPSIFRAHALPQGPGVTSLRLQLPPDTPPGRYNGEVKLGDTTHPLLVVVSARLRTRIVPKKIALDAEPGGRAEFEIVASNDGNVPVEVPQSGTFDLDSDEGQDRALGVSLRAKLAAGEKRVDRYFEELRLVHGGEARVSVLSGAGPLEPGESRTLRCRLEIPMTAPPGGPYIGAWMVGATSQVVAVTVRQPAPRNGGRKQ